MPIIDTHVHYNLPPLLTNWQELWRRSQQVGVMGSLIVGVDLKSSQQAIEHARSDDKLWAAVGIHPTTNYQTEDLQKLEQLAESDQVIALGECGLDYFRLSTDKKIRDKSINQQKQLLTHQIELAHKLKLPLSIHLRDRAEQAYWDFLEIYQQSTQPPFVLHCVSGSLEFVQKAINLGAYVGVDGNITYKNAQDLIKIVKEVPKERVLLETDAPYLPPMPYRGKTCLPEMIKLTADYLLQELQIETTQIVENTQRFFPAFKE